MKNFIQNGDSLTLPAPYAVSGGQLVVVGQLVGIAVHAAAQGEDVTIQRGGVFDIGKPSALVLTAGGEVWADAANGAIVAKAAGKVLVGAAVAAAGAGVLSCQLLLHGGVATIAA